LTDLESDRVERKESLSSPERIRQAICAFANDLPDHRSPGYIFLGADNSGQPTQLPITEQVLLTLADMKTDGNILPIPSLTVQKVTLRRVPVAVVEVHPSEMPPVRLRGQAWIRVGPRRAVATLDEERRLTERRITGAKTFDQQPCTEAGLDDLLLEPFRAEYLPKVVDVSVVAVNNRLPEEQLASLRFFDVRRGFPTHAGILVFGRDPLPFVPGAYIQFVRYDGNSLADPVRSHKVMTGNLVTQLRQLDELLPIQIRTKRVPGKRLQRRDKADYPLVAVRELALNAVMHRSYEGTSAPVRISWFEDRVEIQNPGGLYGQVTPENFRQVSDYRNPVIAEAMKGLGYVEKFGSGIARALEAFRANGNEPAEFTFERTHVLVEIRARG